MSLKQTAKTEISETEMSLRH